MSEEALIKILKVSIVIGLILLAMGIYFHFVSEWAAQLGVTGIIISAACIAVGLIFSLPTKIFLTILLMKREQDNK